MRRILILIKAKIKGSMLKNTIKKVGTPNTFIMKNQIDLTKHKKLIKVRKLKKLKKLKRLKRLKK